MIGAHVVGQLEDGRWQRDYQGARLLAVIRRPQGMAVTPFPSLPSFFPCHLPLTNDALLAMARKQKKRRSWRKSLGRSYSAVGLQPTSPFPWPDPFPPPIPNPLSIALLSLIFPLSSLASSLLQVVVQCLTHVVCRVDGHGYGRWSVNSFLTSKASPMALQSRDC